MNLVVRIRPKLRDPQVIAELARGFLRAVVAVNRVEIRMRAAAGRPFPSTLPELHAAGVRYKREPRFVLSGSGELVPRRFDEFVDFATVMARKWGDCEDLAAIRVAQLQELGELDADIRIYWRSPKDDGSMTMHVQVRRGKAGDYAIEDSSRFLGL